MLSIFDLTSIASNYSEKKYKLEIFDSQAYINLKSY